MKIDARCVVCNHQGEDGSHLFLHCKMMLEIWLAVGLEKERERLCRTGSAAEMVSECLQMEGKKLILIATLLRTWWNERNRRREGEKGRSVAEIAFIAASQAQEFALMNEVEHSGVIATRQEVRRWSPSVGHVVKVNSDGAFCPQNRTGSWGFVLRDSSGEVISAATGNLPQALDPFHSKVMGCLMGISEAARHGIANVLVETDSLILV